MRERYFYRIEHLNLEPGMHRSGFTIEVSRTFLRRALRSRRNENAVAFVTDVMRQRLANSGLLPKECIDQCHILFYRDTSLPMVFCQSPMASCDLGLDGNELSAFAEEAADLDEEAPGLTYIPHNVDSPAQAFGLLIMFQTWAEIMAPLFGEESAESADCEAI